MGSARYDIRHACLQQSAHRDARSVYIAGRNSHESAIVSRDFYLSSTDTYGLETPQRVRRIKRQSRDHLELTEVQTIAWADLYETEQDALSK